jgi:hypothetical protein
MGSSAAAATATYHELAKTLSSAFSQHSAGATGSLSTPQLERLRSNTTAELLEQVLTV